jgi:ketosteroid isomerase-like protein
MSEANVDSVADDNIELIRHALDLYNTGDVDAFVDLFTDDCELETDPRFPEGGTFSGRESARRFIAGLHQGWEGGSAVTVKKMWPAGDSVLAYWSWHATGQRSGIDVSSDWFALWTLRGGRIARVRFFSDRAAALEAAGLTTP